jgi:hypothetical protein
MHRIYDAENLIDAQLVKDALEAEGIPAFVWGSALTGAIGELPVMGYVAVWVPDGAVPQAAAIVAEVDAALAEARRCGSEGDSPKVWPHPV